MDIFWTSVVIMHSSKNSETMKCVGIVIKKKKKEKETVKCKVL